MNAVLVRGRVNQLRGGSKARWSRMTGNRFGRVSGQMRRLMGKAQVAYGRAKGTTKRLIG
jgi:uncharacterized protein YjbJ (UPF0337 family)